MPGVEHPLMLDLPYSFETERLLIRAPRRGDGAIIQPAVEASRAELRQWMPWAAVEASVEATEKMIRQRALSFESREDLMMLLFERESSEFVGASGLHRIKWSIPRMEIGYWLHSAQTGRGYATEAVLGITDFAFTHLHAERVTIHCDPRNTRSAAVAERAGYHYEVTLRHTMRDVEGQLTDEMVFYLLRETWEARRSSQTRPHTTPPV
jgi:RimJ/RimL family protein N-acetyltransferase